jgi:SHS2 domain-containing protein
MSYKFFENTSIADMAFEATGKSVKELFESAALAVTNVMAKDLGDVRTSVKREITVSSADISMLLYDFLQDIIYLKDAERLLFGKYDIEIEKTEDNYVLKCTASGEKIDPKRHNGVDVKAVTMHRYEVKQGRDGWRAFVVLDI